MSNPESKAGRLKRYMEAPKRLLIKARDVYVDSMVNFDQRVSYANNVMGCPPPPPQMSRPSNFYPPRKPVIPIYHHDDQNFAKRILHRVVKFRNPTRKMEYGESGLQRSCSVGLGRIGTIDEDRPYDFEEEEIIMKSEILVPRSKSYALSSKRSGY